MDGGGVDQSKQDQAGPRRCYRGGRIGRACGTDPDTRVRLRTCRGGLDIETAGERAHGIEQAGGYPNCKIGLTRHPREIDAVPERNPRSAATMNWIDDSTALPS